MTNINVLAIIIASIFTLVNFSIAQFNAETVKFKLAAANLPNCDWLTDASSDPYVRLLTGTTGGRHHSHWNKWGETSVKYDTLNPTWDEVFAYQYFNGTNQKWLFIVYDLDNSWYNPFDDPLGRVQVNVDEYMFRMRNARQNNTEIIKPLQMFLHEPLGGVLYITPVFE